MIQTSPGQRPKADFRREGLGYVWEPTGVGISMRIQHLKQSSGGDLRGMLMVRADRKDVVHHLGNVTHNVAAASSRTSLAKTLFAMAPAIKLEEWIRLVTLFSDQIIEAEDMPEPILQVGRMARQDAPPDAVEKIVQTGQITTLYGPPGAGKGWIAVAIAVHVALGIPFCGLVTRKMKPLYLDWEADIWTFNARMQAVCEGLGIDPIEIGWLHPKGTLPKQAHRLAQAIAEGGYDFIIVDSVGMAAGSPGEHGSYEDQALALGEALALLGVNLSILLIDHVSAEGAKEKLAGKAIGAYRKHMIARVGWEVRKVQTQDTDEQFTTMTHTKFNNTREFKPIGVEMRFESDERDRAKRITFKRRDVMDVPGAIEQLSLPDRVLAELRFGRATTPELCSRLGVSSGTMRSCLGRLEAQGKVRGYGPEFGGSGKSKHWGLPADGGPVPLQLLPRDVPKPVEGDGCRECGEWLKGSLVQLGLCEDCLQEGK